VGSYAVTSSVAATRGITAVLHGDERGICGWCVVADRAIARMKGLLGRSGLDTGEGLLIRPAPTVHTFFMRFAIDIVFLARDGEVLKVATDVKPWRARSCRGAYAVLEVAAGEAAKRRIARGDRLVFRGVTT
jgi:uncharacterized protein